MGAMLVAPTAAQASYENTHRMQTSERERSEAFDRLVFLLGRFACPPSIWSVLAAAFDCVICELSLACGGSVVVGARECCSIATHSC